MYQMEKGKMHTEQMGDRNDSGRKKLWKKEQQNANQNNPKHVGQRFISLSSSLKSFANIFLKYVHFVALHPQTMHYSEDPSIHRG